MPNVLLILSVAIYSIDHRRVRTSISYCLNTVDIGQGNIFILLFYGTVTLQVRILRQYKVSDDCY